MLIIQCLVKALFSMIRFICIVTVAAIAVALMIALAVAYFVPFIITIVVGYLVVQTADNHSKAARRRKL